MGVNTQLFTLNLHNTIEPRVGVNYFLNEKNTISFGYGIHSRIEPLNIYFAKTINTTVDQANNSLDFSKAQHFVFAYDWVLSEKTHLKIEPYFQLLYNIPIVENTTNSILNLQNDWFINDSYLNSGKGKNYGIDLTLEQYINNGFYYLLSGSIFDSKYKTKLSNWHNTRFNKHFLFNIIAGKEFKVGKAKQNILGLNFRISIQGGDRYSNVDHSTSLQNKDVVYHESDPFSEQSQTAFISHFTLNYE